MPVEPHIFRKIAGSFPSGVTVVTTMDPSGVPKGLTSQGFMAVSTEPPLVLVSLDKRSRTLPALRESQALVINFLSARSEHLSVRFASKDDDKFAGLSWRSSALAKGSPILLEGIVAHAECLVVHSLAAGDHILFLASVEDGAVSDADPLLYFRRSYAGWPGTALQPS